MSIELQEICKEIKLWRSQKKSSQSRIPSNLKERIFSLRGENTDGEILRSLNLNYGFFKQKNPKFKLSKKYKKKIKAVSPNGSFIKLPKVVETKVPKLIINLPNGCCVEFFE